MPMFTVKIRETNVDCVWPKITEIVQVYAGQSWGLTHYMGSNIKGLNYQIKREHLDPVFKIIRDIPGVIEAELYPTRILGPGKVAFEVPFSDDIDGPEEGDTSSFELFDPDTSQLKNKDNIIDTNSTIKIHFDYPLNNPTTLEFTTKDNAPVTIEQFAKFVLEGYTKIYEEEAKTTFVQPTKSQPMADGGTLLNRNSTDGKYGIWGHVMEDLALDYAEKDSEGVWQLTMES